MPEYRCPEGHPCQDHTASAVNTGIYCPTCRDWRKCERCGWEGRRQDVTRYVGNAEAVRLGLAGVRRDRADGGLYGVCPNCGNGPVHGKADWWLNVDRLLRAGGKVE